MALTAKQEAFCQGIADGLTQADAYRRAYNAENMADSTVYVKSSELMADGKISGRVQEMRDKLAEALIWRRADSVKVLSEIARAAEEAKPSERVSAVKELNAMHGFNEPTRVDVGLQVLRLNEHDERI
jgi:phage terminase small subunit